MFFNSVPQWTHDCAACTFLGTLDEYDLYHHESSIPTLIARYGDDGPEYLSGLAPSSLGPQLDEARKRAEHFGLRCELVRKTA